MDPHAAKRGTPERPFGCPACRPGRARRPAAPSIRASGPLRKSDFRDPRLDRDTRRLLKKQFKLEQKLLRQQFRLERASTAASASAATAAGRTSARSISSPASRRSATRSAGSARCTSRRSTTRESASTRGPSFFHEHHFIAAAYLIFVAMLFDALDGRLARFTRHTTDFGGQLDSLADVISFGAAPAFLALAGVQVDDLPLPAFFARLFWAIGALYMSCAAIRLARFNVSNEHGEQHHFSFLGLPSPGAGGAVAAFILMQQDLYHGASLPPPTVAGRAVGTLSIVCLWLLPLIVRRPGC